MAFSHSTDLYMKPILTALQLRIVVFAILVSAGLSSGAQVRGTLTGRPGVSTSDHSGGFWEWLPPDYHTTTQTYPLLISLNGLSGRGTGLTQAALDTITNIQGGLFFYLRYQPDFPNLADANKFIILSPQWKDEFVDPIHVNQVIDYAIANYRVNTAKIYLEGISQGGGYAFNYVGANSTYANRIAAIVPFGAATPEPFEVTGPTPAKGRVIAEANVAVYAFHNKSDVSVPIHLTTDKWIEYINTPTPPNPVADTTTPDFPNGQHNVWDPVYLGQTTYNNFFNPQANEQNATLNGKRFFEWLLQFSRAGNSILPVSFAGFNAACNGGKLNLKWNTANEQNTKEFSIEKSIDGTSWTFAGTIRANGQSSSVIQYSYQDNTPSNYYRIVAVDHDGRKTTSPVIRSSCAAKEMISVFPNPARQTTSVSIQLNAATRVKLQVYNSKGALVYQLESLLQQGVNQIPIDLKANPSGMYIMTAEWNGQKQTIKLMKE